MDERKGKKKNKNKRAERDGKEQPLAIFQEVRSLHYATPWAINRLCSLGLLFTAGRQVPQLRMRDETLSENGNVRTCRTDAICFLAGVPEQIPRMHRYDAVRDPALGWD